MQLLMNVHALQSTLADPNPVFLQGRIRILSEQEHPDPDTMNQYFKSDWILVLDYFFRLWLEY